MSGSRRFDVEEHLSEEELDTAINEAQKADETRLVRRLCFVKNLYAGDLLEEAAKRVGVSQANSSRWAHAWNDDGVDGLRPSFGGGRPPKLTPEQFDELCDILEEEQPWTLQEIHTHQGAVRCDVRFGSLESKTPSRRDGLCEAASNGSPASRER